MYAPRHAPPILPRCDMPDREPDSREERLRLQLRARALDALAAVPEGFDSRDGVTAREEARGWECVVTVRRAGHLGPAEPASPPPVQQFLPGCWLSDIEQAVVDALAEAGARMPMPAIREAIEARLSRAVPEGQLKTLLARMTSVRILDNSKKAKPPGYAVTEEFRRLGAPPPRGGQGRAA